MHPHSALKLVMLSLFYSKNRFISIEKSLNSIEETYYN